MLYCVGAEMWIDAGRTCDTDDDNRRIDWKSGLVTVTVSPSCSTLHVFLIYSLPFDTKHGNSQTPYKKASSYIAQYPVRRTVRFTLYFPDRHVHLDAISASLVSIKPYTTINALTNIHHCL